MALRLQELQQREAITNQDGTPSQYFLRYLRSRGGALTDLEAELINKADKTTQIIAGAGLTGGGDLSEDRTLSVDEQAVLDSISTAQGSVLYRGATDWAALAPGTSGDVLTTNGAGANPSWTTPAAGGGGYSLGAFYSGTILAPVYTDYTLSTGASFTASSLSSNGNGMTLRGKNTSFNHAVAEKAITSTSGDVTVTGVIMLAEPNSGAWGGGIYLLDDTGKRQSYGLRNTSTWRFRFSSLTDAGTVKTMTGGAEMLARPVAIRLRKASGTLYFELAMDGANWVTMYSESATTYLSNNIVGYGLTISPNNTTTAMGCYHLQAT